MYHVSDVIQDCGNYVELLKRGKKGCYLIRGVSDDNIDISRYDHSIIHRSPRNMIKAVHEAINHNFTDIFGWPVRNGLFCNGASPDILDPTDLGYGKSYLVFPCDQFKYVGDKEIFDLYEFYIDFFKKNATASIADFLKEIKYSDDNLTSLMSTISHNERSVEIIINCEKYYLLNLNYVKELTQLIWTE